MYRKVVFLKKAQLIKVFLIHNCTSIVGIIIGFFLFCFNTGDVVFSRMEFVLNAVMSCTATISGFILTSISVLLGLSSSQLMNNIRKDGSFKELSYRYIESLVTGFLVIVFCILMGTLIGQENRVAYGWIAMLIGILFSYLFSIFSSGYYLLTIITIGASVPEIDSQAVQAVPSSLL